METAEQQETRKKVPVSDTELLAVRLHAQRTLVAQLRAALHEKDGVILRLETALMEVENERLREKHGLVVGREILRDEVSGEPYYFEDEAG
jgi:hypothetical protein